MKNTKAVVMMSGGPDSFVAAYWAQREFRNAIGLFVDVGHEAADKERESYKEQIDYLGLESLELDLSGFMSGFSQINPNSKSIFKGAGLPLLPFSGAIALSIGISVAASQNTSNLVLGLHQVDFNNDEYNLQEIQAISDAALCNNRPVKVQIPFQDISKIALFSYGIEHGLPLEKSWSCIYGNRHHCGMCKPCISRHEALGISYEQYKIAIG